MRCTISVGDHLLDEVLQVVAEEALRVTDTAVDGLVEAEFHMR